MVQCRRRPIPRTWEFRFVSCWLVRKFEETFRSDVAVTKLKRSDVVKDKIQDQGYDPRGQ
jgi:hypothetical protein